MHPIRIHSHPQKTPPIHLEIRFIFPEIFIESSRVPTKSLKKLRKNYLEK